MTFQTVPVNITGPSYQSRSRPLSSQITKNWYQQFNEGLQESYVLMPFPGLKSIGNAEGLDRGFYRMSEKLYQVKGSSLYEISSDGTHILRGSIPGTSRAIMASDGINLFIVANLNVWQYSTDTNLVTEVTDVNIKGSKSVDFFNNQFIYTGDKFSTISDVGDGSAANGLNIVGEETLPDPLVRDFVFNEVIYRCGTRSIVGWYNSGVGFPPIERMQGRIFNIGLAAINSIAKTDEAFYWLGDDHAIYRASSGTNERISTDAMTNELQLYPDLSGSIGSTFTMQGKSFYAITIPQANKTFVVNESLGVSGWFEVSSGVDGDQYQGASLINAYGSTIAADNSNGNIYKLDFNTYTNNNEPIHRVRVTQSANGSLLGATGKRVQMSQLKILMESGVGLVSGQGDNPRIMIEHSDDGGRSWSAGSWPRVGRLGEFTLQVEWFNLDSFYDRIFRISTTDPVNYSVYSATIDLRLAGK